MLAYYVEWHMREAWRPLLFADEDLAAKANRDPVAPAKRSAAAIEKAATKTLPDGTPAHSFRTLLEQLSHHRAQHLPSARGTRPRRPSRSSPRPAAEQQRAMRPPGDDRRVDSSVHPEIPYLGESTYKSARATKELQLS